ncbi:MAG: efflux RND transporter periplasmic adaptor subunit [Eubacteriales bacterium]|nr:efflux RND transporter periplasmic adaptor subunit [Eubacteriales bacterium]
MGKLSSFFKSHRKSTIITLVVIVVIASVSGVLVAGRNKANSTAKVETNVTLLAEKNLDQIITTKGTIQSTAKHTVYTQLTAKVSEIAVDVGDVVGTGDFLAQLDTRDYEKSITELQTNIGTASKQQSTLINQAAKRVTDANDQKTIDMQQKQQAIDDAAENLADAKNDLDDSAKKSADASVLAEAMSDSRVASATSVLSIARSAMTANDEEIIDLEAEIERLTVLIDDLVTDPGESAYAGAKTTAETALIAAKLDDPMLTAAYNDALAAYENTVNAVEEDVHDDDWKDDYDAAYSAGHEAIDAAQAAYDAAVTAYNNITRSNDLSIQEKSYSLSNQKLQDSTATLESQLETAKLNIEDARITAPIGGTITEVIAALGSRPNGALFVIQDTASLEISTTVAEYDIPKISVGQEVRFTTEATSGDELTGTVELISPTAINTDGDFEVVVKINVPDNRLRIGMNAKLTIVLESRAAVYSVPYDAIIENADGVKVVVAIGDDGVTRTEIPVEVGMETDYFVEIGGAEIKAGLTILNDPLGRNVVTVSGPTGPFSGN